MSVSVVVRIPATDTTIPYTLEKDITLGTLFGIVAPLFALENDYHFLSLEEHGKPLPSSDTLASCSGKTVCYHSGCCFRVLI